MSNNNIQIKLLDETTIQKQAEIVSWGFHDQECTQAYKEHWYIKHYCNPLGKSWIFGAYIDDKLVGIKAYYLTKYAFHDTIFNIIMSCDSTVLRAYRGRGIWSELVNYAMDYLRQNVDYNAVISFPNYTNTYIGFQKLGWQKVDILTNYAWINCGYNFAKCIFRHRMLQFLGSAILSPFLTITHAWTKILALNNATVVSCRPQQLLLGSNDDRIHLYLTEQVLDWKIRMQNLLPISILQNNTIIATCLYQLSTYNGQKIIKLYHIGYKNGYYSQATQIIATLLHFLIKQYSDVAFIRIWAMSKDMNKDSIKKNLFIKTTHPNPFILKANAPLFTNEWDVSLLDLDY